MKPSQPDDAGSPSSGRPRPGSKPVPPAVVYALDCLEPSPPAQVRRHMVAMGYTQTEAADAVRQALAEREPEHPSAWGPDDAAARRCMAVGFLLLLFGICVGCLRVYLAPLLPGGVPLALNVVTW